MKKLLALVLALVMTLSLCTVTNAAYPDDAAIDYDEAVAVMSSVGVFKGDEKGNFNPDANLTRETAAKLIAYLDLGEKVAEALPAVKVFSDVEANRWSAKYVAYCADAGYIAGTGDGSYNPTGELTGYAFGKLLLCVLGYDANIEGFTGANWSINVAKFMQSNDIAKGVDKSASAVLTREEAAQYCLNALKADCVEYDNGGTTITTGDVTITTGASKAEPVANNVADDYRTTNTDAVQQLIEKLYPKMVLNNATTDADDFGRPAVIWENDGDEIGTYADAADYVLVAQKDTTMAELLKDNSLEKKVTSGFTGTDPVTCGTVVELWVESKAVTEKVTYNYVLVTVDDVEKIDDEAELYKDYDATVEYTLACDETISGTVVDVLSESKTGYQAIGSFEKDDVLVAVVDGGKILEIAKADSFNGKVAAKGTNYVKVDGTKYAILNSLIPADFDKTYTFYQDPNGVVVGKEVYEEAESALSYAYVLGFNKKVASDLYSTENSAKVKLLFTDGTVKTVNYNVYKATSGANKGEYVAKLNGTETLLTALTVAEGWYAYTENDAGAVTLKSAVKADVSAKLDVSAKKDVKTVATNVYATSTTAVSVFNEDGLVKTYTGYAKFPGTALTADTDHALVVYGSSTKYAKAVYIYDGTASEDAETIDVALFVSTGDVTEDGTVCTFYVDGAKKEYTVDTVPTGAKAGKIYKITLTDDIATLAALDSAAYKKGNIKVVSDEYVILDSTEVTLANGCTVYLVSMDGKTVSKTTLTEGKDAVAILNSDGKATQIFIYKDITLF